MIIEDQLNTLAAVSYLPAGAVNTRTGAAVDGPGGRWVPCATRLAGGRYVACLFEVGSGRRQVCGDATPRLCEADAMARAEELAAIAAA